MASVVRILQLTLHLRVSVVSGTVNRASCQHMDVVRFRSSIPLDAEPAPGSSARPLQMLQETGPMILSDTLRIAVRPADIRSGGRA